MVLAKNSQETVGNWRNKFVQFLKGNVDRTANEHVYANAIQENTSRSRAALM